jgi:hypothetical protein
MSNDNWKEFSVKAANRENFPDFCPACGNSASKQVKVYTYDMEASPGEIFAFGMIGQLLRFIIGGYESIVKMVVPVCEHCASKALMFKIGEWLVRIVSIVLCAILLMDNSTKSRPLAQRGLGPILMVFSPLIIGGIIAYILRSKSDRSKGVVFIKEGKDQNFFRGKRSDWVDDFTAKNLG